MKRIIEINRRSNLIISTFFKMSSDSSSSSSSPTPSKKSKPSTSSKSGPKVSLKGTAGAVPQQPTENLKKVFEADRKAAAKSIIDFKFNKKRIRILSKTDVVADDAKGIVYWMSRDARVQDNWAFLFAQKLAMKNKVSLHVCFCLVPKFLEATIRHYKFMLSGLEEVERECVALNIQFHLINETAAIGLPKFVKQHNIGGVVCDFSPLRVPMQWVQDVKENLPKTIAFCQVDAHNIVPVWVTSEKQEYAARTIRKKVNDKLSTFLTQFPPVVRHTYAAENQSKNVDWEKAIKSVQVDRSVDKVDWAQPGYTSAVKHLEIFFTKRLRLFNDKRNDPLIDASSNMSPWFHFGQISVQRCILAVNKHKSRFPESVAAFCEEAIVRRELSDNFCFYNPHYDSLKGLASWALESLNAHKKDKRQWIYSREELETSKTHDDLWNSAQIQLNREGKMHGFLRMYWAKKILEWTTSPEEALAFAIYLNDKYSLDGRDPNGYVGCMWSIGGIHDMGWKEREIFGKIRFMNYDGCKRKFDVKAFVARYGGKVYGKKK